MNNEYNFEEIMNRLKIASNTKSYNALADLLGLSSSGFANLKKRESIPYDKIIGLASSLNVSIDWMLTGEGEMQKTTPATATPDLKTAKMAELLEGLNEQQQREIFAAVEKEKRLNDLIETVNQLQKKIG